MRLLRRLLEWLLIFVTAIACAPAPNPSAQDAFAPYRPAMLDAYQKDLNHLPPLPRYDLILRVDPFTRRLSGQGTLSVPNRHTIPLTELYLRLFPNLPQYHGTMQVQTMAINGQITAFELAVEDTAVHVLLSEPLLPGHSAVVSYTWTVDAPSIETGYALFGESQGILSLPLSYPTLTVSEMGKAGQRLNWHLEIAPPHGDVAFLESALYQAQVITAPDVMVIGSGTVVSKTITADGQATWYFVTGPVREFMLLLSRHFQQFTGRAYDTLVHSYFLPEDREAGQRALEYAIAAAQVYSDHYGRYPFTDLSVVSAPLEYRGMEYPGINLIGVDIYRRRRADLEFLIAHELAHQWWYNLVGSDPVNYPWLDEGLAEYSTYIYYESVYGKEAAERLRQNRWELPVAYAKENGLDTIVGQPASGFGPANYETMVYAKSALFFHALRMAIGDDAFFRLLQTLLSDYRYQIMTPDIFLEEAQKISGKDLRPLYREWILSAKKL
jgi:hypothetical protein